MSNVQNPNHRTPAAILAFNQAVERKVKAGLKRAAAVKAVVAEDPGLHQEYLKAVARRRPPASWWRKTPTSTPRTWLPSTARGSPEAPIGVSSENPQRPLYIERNPMSPTKSTPPEEATADRIDAPVAADPTTAAAPEPDLTSKLAERLARREQELSAEQQLRRERASSAYFRVVLGSSAPTEEEFEEFVDACSTLKIEPVRIEKHQRMVAKARKAEAEWEEHCQHEAALPMKENAVAELRLQFAPQLELLRSAESEVSALRNLILATHGAAERLKRLAESSPDLFDLQASPPRLRRFEKGGERVL